MKNLITKFNAAILGLLLLSSFAACKKDQLVTSETYDRQNRIFRVHVVASKNIPFKVLITQVNSAAVTDIINVTQNTGTEFNYGFTPDIGTTVSVKINAEKPLVSYALYNGVSTSKIELKLDSDGNYSGEYSYSVTQ